MITDPTASGALDPQLDGSFEARELFRCCLLRTLLSYNGHPTNQGGHNSARIWRTVCRTCPRTV